MAAVEQSSGGGSARQALALVARGREVWGAMPERRRSRLILSAVVLAVICALVAWWGGRTEWKVLYSGLDGRDLQQVQGELAAANISYEATADGLGVQVPAEMLDKARMEVAAKGMPQSGRMGFELFDKSNWVGSEFDERVNFQRALEGELEHTIATIGSVRSSRVHLVLPKESLFSGEEKAAKASVVLKLKRANLGRSEVESIRNLVSGAVEGLVPDQVVLVDADGKTNLSVAGQSAQGGEAEQALEQKLVAMLEPLSGRDNVRATVNLVYDQGRVERTDEVVDPTQVTALTTDKRDLVTGSPAKALGIPGTASNTAAGAAVGSAAALPVFPTAASQQQTNHEENSTFAVTRHTTHEEQGPGRIVRVTAAVVVNDREVLEGLGKQAHTAFHARTADEMRRMEQLAQAAVGFDAKRGDQLVMQNISFQANQPEIAASGVEKVSAEALTFLRQQPELLRTAGAGLLAVLLVMMVVRPVAKQTMVLLGEPLAMTGGAGARGGLGAGEVAAKLPEGDSAKEVALSRGGDEGVLEYVAAHIQREPLESTRLLGSWIDMKERA